MESNSRKIISVRSFGNPNLVIDLTKGKFTAISLSSYIHKTGLINRRLREETL